MLQYITTYVIKNKVTLQLENSKVEIFCHLYLVLQFILPQVAPCSATTILATDTFLCSQLHNLSLGNFLCSRLHTSGISSGTLPHNPGGQWWPHLITSSHNPLSLFSLLVTRLRPVGAQHSKQAREGYASSRFILHHNDLESQSSFIFHKGRSAWTF